jgi:hypothetical protein
MLVLLVAFRKNLFQPGEILCVRSVGELSEHRVTTLAMSIPNT